LPLQTSRALRSDELMLILQGISLKSVHRRKRFDIGENNFESSSRKVFVNG
jgi:hypothetical protein